MNLREIYLRIRFGKRDAWRRFYRKPPLDSPIESVRFTVLDTETTGLNARRDTLVSVGAVKVLEGLSLDLSTSFHRFVRVGNIRREAIEVHGITPEEISRFGDSPEKVIGDLMEYITGTVVVGFNVEFDRKFLERHITRIYHIPFPFYRLDVLSLWRRMGGQVASLEEVAKALGVPVTGVHSAIDDAYITALIFLKLIAPIRREPLKVLPLVI